MEQQKEKSERAVVLAVDGSEQSKKAFNWYMENIQRDGDHVFVLTVGDFSQKINFGILPGNYSEERLKEIIEQVQAESNKVEVMLADFVEQLRAKRIHGEAAHIPEKNVGAGICEFAEKHNASMICMGTRGLGTMRRTVLGSVSDFVVHHSRCPCIIVH
ncbi:universal stress protein PHOS32-like [Pecten maximus]|uniref:universal stress protein PHOS32-like n=1 Tax=Pecten maximus TaxID=6579 RepID=UPI001458808A|nr:universal stress protein PHOS32-like [Pecten maximus]